MPDDTLNTDGRREQGARVLVHPTVDLLKRTIDAISRDLARHAPGTSDLENLVIFYCSAVVARQPDALLSCGCAIRQIRARGGGVDAHEARCDIRIIAAEAHAVRMVRAQLDQAARHSGVQLPPIPVASDDPAIAGWAMAQCREDGEWSEVQRAANGNPRPEAAWIKQHHGVTEHRDFLAWSVVKAPAYPDPDLD